MRQNFLGRLIVAIFTSFVLLVPAILGGALIYSQEEFDYKSCLGLGLILVSLIWFFKRMPEFLRSIQVTTELNAKFKERLRNRSLILQASSRSFYFRKWWTLLLSPLNILALLLIIFGNSQDPQQILGILFLGFACDYFILPSSCPTNCSTSSS